MDGPLMATVKAFFDSQSIPIAQLDDTSMMITRYEGQNGAWRCIASVDEEAETFVFYSLLDSLLPTDVDPARRSEVVEFLMRATTGLTVGNFELDYGSNDIFFRTSVDVEGDLLSPPLVANIVATNLMVVDHYLPALEQVADGSALARDAIADVDGSDAVD
jgi:hypothetical protein